MRQIVFPLWITSNITGWVIVFLLSNNPARSQIIPDNTLPVNSIVTPAGNIFNITGGSQAGGNLFHSFSQFSLPTNNTAIFNNPTNIQNIITRVTGNSISNIDGLLQANGSTNLFLINPNGIIFGPNARLNLGGSFFATTANSIKFADGIEFNTKTPQTNPLLSINVPIGLQFGTNIGSIQIQGAYLQVQPGKTLAIAGGNININGGYLKAPGGQINIGAVGETATIGIGSDNSLNFPDTVTNPILRGDIVINNQSILDVVAPQGGNININTRNIEISGESIIAAGIESGNTNIENKAGNISINATENIILTDNSALSNRVPGETIGNGGDININTKTLNINNGHIYTIINSGQGNAGNININALDTVSLAGGSNGYYPGIFSSTTPGSIGNSGSINISTGSLIMKTDTSIDASNGGKGNAGNVIINARDTVSLDGGLISSEMSKESIGNGGDININTGNLNISNSTFLNASTYGKGNAGNIIINIRNNGNINSSYIWSQAQAESEGNSGSININAGSSFYVNNNSILNASTYGKGNAKNITINTGDNIAFDGSMAISQTFEQAIGNGGSISLNTGSVSLSNYAGLNTGTSGKGNAGIININARDRIFLDKANIFSYVFNTGVGNSGEININTRNIELKNTATLNSGTFGQGNAGNIVINATDTITFDNSNALNTTGGESNGKGGIININTNSLILKNLSTLSVATSGKGNAGILNINAQDKVSLDSSNILADVSTAQTIGNAGNININARSLDLTNKARLYSGTAGSGNAGNITMNVSDRIFLDGSLIFSNVLPTALGNGGNITANTDQLILNNGAIISAVTGGRGNAGNILINGKNIEINGNLVNNNIIPSYLFAGVLSTSTGKGGTINVNTDKLTMTNTSQINVSSLGIGDPGNANIIARQLQLNNRAAITAASATGEGGNINLRSQNIRMRYQSGIYATGGQNENPVWEGNINIETTTLALLEASKIITSAFDPRGGGNISIFGSNLIVLRSPDSIINAVGKLDIKGDIEVRSPDISYMEIADITNLIGQESCKLNKGSQFIVTGKGGLPPSPTEFVSSDNIIINWGNILTNVTHYPRANSPSQLATSLIDNAKSPIIEANGWIINSNGKIVLTANIPGTNSNNLWLTAPKCTLSKLK